MNTDAYNGGEYSYLIPLLLSEKSSGHVHSVFVNGLNILMGDSLIFIGNKKSGRLPFGIHLQEDISNIVSLVKNREPVYWDEEASLLQFQQMSISIKEGKSFKNKVVPLRSNTDLQIGFERLLSHLSSIKQLTGLDIDISDFIKKFDYVNYNNYSDTEKSIINLIHVAMSDDLYLIEKTLRYFLGRGKGLTPSGDDLLVGFLAFNSISNFVSSFFYNQLSALIENELITTDVSKEYLRYALRHEFSSTVTDMVNILSDSNDNFQEVVEGLLEVGHSSGLDTLFGILIGLLAFKNPIEQ